MLATLFRCALLSTLLAASVARAEELPEWFNQPDNWFTAALAPYTPTDNPGQLTHPGTGYDLLLALTAPLNSVFALDIEAHIGGAEYDTPPYVSGGPFSVVDPRSRVNIAGLAIGGELAQRLGPLRLFATVGGGLYQSTLRITGSTLGFPGSDETRSTNLGYHAGFGFTWRVAKKVLVSASYRRQWLPADFGNRGNGAVELGGDYRYLGLGFFN